MAYQITPECSACGICIGVCPNSAIAAWDSLYAIDPVLCTECLGYADTSACCDICPDNAVVLLVSQGIAAPARNPLRESPGGGC